MRTPPASDTSRTSEHAYSDNAHPASASQPQSQAGSQPSSHLQIQNQDRSDSVGPVGQANLSRRTSTTNGRGAHIRIQQLSRPHLQHEHRSLSEIVRAVRSREEQETLLEEDGIADPDGCVRADTGVFVGPREVFSRDPHRDLRVYYNIHR